MQSVKNQVVGQVVTRDVKVAITSEQFVDMLHRVKGVTFASFETNTCPKMNKRGNEKFFGKVEKLCKVFVMLGADYENCVNNTRIDEIVDEALAIGIDNELIKRFLDKKTRKELEATAEEINTPFEAKPMPWGHFIVNPLTGKISRIMIEHTPEETGLLTKYVRTIPLGSESPIYRWKESGIALTEAEVAEMKTFFPGKHSNADWQGVKEENEILVRTYQLPNIYEVKMNKTHYAVN